MMLLLSQRLLDLLLVSSGVTREDQSPPAGGPQKPDGSSNMRDRLEKLQRVQTDSEGFSVVELSNLSEHEAAAVPDQDLDGILQEAQRVRLEIQQIQNDIRELRDVNFQALNGTSFPAVTKRDSNAIGADIKRRGEAVLQQLHALNDLQGELEVQRGPSDPAARIARTQYHYLSNALREVMSGYNDAEMSHREACKRHIQRQMEVVGTEVTEQDIEKMMEVEELCVFSVNETGKTASSALKQIESRHQELLELETRVQGIQELFLDVAMLVGEQGAEVDSIEKNVQDVTVNIQNATTEIGKATKSDKNNPFKKMFCGCFPCYYN